MKSRVLTISIFLLMAVQMVFGQTRKAWLKAADDAFERKDYFSALSYYNEALEFERDFPTLYRSAESARLFDAYSTAAAYYMELIEREAEGLPLIAYHLGQMQQRRGAYEEAIDAYNLFISLQEDTDARYSRIAKKEIEACHWAQYEIENPKKHITVEHLENGVNTGYSEFGGVKTETALFFSSLRFANQNSEREPPRIFSRNLIKDFEGINVDSSYTIDDTLHIAHTAFNADETKMYYTICEYLNDKDIRCDLYVRTRNRAGVWSEGTKLPQHINTGGFTTTQPNLIYDEELEREILYYVSDAPGGKGGTDIWYTVIDPSGNYSLPMNLSGINTPDNEFTPFFHSKTQTLYFSSDGYLGMGGYDIYKVFMGGDEWGEVINMGVPVNTSFHDVYFTLDEEGGEAYFSSNRTGSLFLDDANEACCYDIYRADIVPTQIDLLAFTFDAKTLDSLEGVTLKVVDLSRGGEVVFDEVHPLNSRFVIPIQCENEYQIIASRPGYRTTDVTLKAPDCGTTTSIEKLLFLEPDVVKLDVFTFDALSRLPLDSCTVRLFDLTTGEVVVSEPDQRGNDFHFDVQRTHRYEVIATKPGYSQAQQIFEVEEDGPSVITQNLYLSPGLQDMLPIVLYFDNDRPDPRTYKSKTNKGYSDTYGAYYLRRDTFVSKYAAAYENVSGTRADVEMTNFFDNRVQAEYERFMLFLDLLENEMKAGRDYDIILKGFASPRASSAYNRVLGQRRIDCVRNEFERHNGGVLAPYIGNLLKISESSVGESEAPPGVSDDLNDEINSIFSPAASNERRVEIIDVKKLRK